MSKRPSKVEKSTAEFNPESIDLILNELQITAKELGDFLGFKYRNQMTKVKKGQRPISGNELIRLCLFSEKPIEFFIKN